LSQPDESEVPEGPGISIDGDSVGWTIFQYVTGLPLEADTRQALFSPAVTGLILVNLMVFVAALIVGFREAMLSMALVPREILDGERLHTLLTSMFAHAGPFHLIGNMWFLFVCGDNTEHRLGLGQFLAMYFLAGLAATTVHIASMPGSQVPALGASGAISGVLGAYMVLFPGRRFLVRFFWFLWFHPITLRIPAWAYLGFWLVLQFLFVFLDAEGVAWWAHIGGFAVGAAWAYAFRAVRSTTEAAPARLT
jgi:membrane associated rhomboid family serine protease